MRRFDPAYVALREAVLGGSIGTVRAAHCLHRNAHSHPSHTDEGLLVELDDPRVRLACRGCSTTRSRR